MELTEVAKWAAGNSDSNKRPLADNPEEEIIIKYIELKNVYGPDSTEQSLEHIFSECGLRQDRIIRREIILLAGQSVPVKKIAQITRFSKKTGQKGHHRCEAYRHGECG